MKASKSKAKKTALKGKPAAKPSKASKVSKPLAKKAGRSVPAKATKAPAKVTKAAGKPKAAKQKPKVAVPAKPKVALPKPKATVAAPPKVTPAAKQKPATPPTPKVAAPAKPKVAVPAKPKVAVAAKPKVAPEMKAMIGTSGPRSIALPTPVKPTPKPVRRAAPRADFGAPIDDFLVKQPPELRVILDALRALIDEAAPHAHASLKWGQPFYALNGAMMCALGAHQAHVNLILVGAPDAFVDPEGRLSGSGSGSRHLKLTSMDDFPRERIRQWLAVSAAYASKRG